MTEKKELMNRFVKQTGTQTFILFYKLIRGNFEIEELSEEEKIISQCIKNECTEENGSCYRYYEEIKKIRKTKNVKRILHLHECILQSMCEKMFFNALKLGSILKETYKQ